MTTKLIQVTFRDIPVFRGFSFRNSGKNNIGKCNELQVEVKLFLPDFL